jgi:hypothetical protein
LTRALEHNRDKNRKAKGTHVVELENIVFELDNCVFELDNGFPDGFLVCSLFS